MTIQNLKELSKLIDLCRKKGIDQIKIDNIELRLGTPPRRGQTKGPSLVSDISSEPDLSDEEILNWSVRDYSGAI
jgi:hypothetical protein